MFDPPTINPQEYPTPANRRTDCFPPSTDENLAVTLSFNSPSFHFRTMKFPDFSPTPSSMENDTVISAVISSSQNEKEKPLSRASSRQGFRHEKGKGAVNTTLLDEAKAIDNLSEEPEYPSGPKLGIIMASLSLSVFLMALVSLVLYVLLTKDTIVSVKSHA